MVTIPSSSRFVKYTPVAASGPFPVPFPLFDDSGADLDVKLNGAAVAGWSFSGTLESGFYGAPNTWINGAITFTAPISGELVIRGRRAPRRTLQFAEGRGVPARDHNVAYNELTAVDQEARRDIDRSVKSPEGEAEMELPAAAARAGKFLGFDQDGKPLANTGSPVTPDLSLVTASQAQAEAASRNDLSMSPLRTKQQIDARLADQPTAEAGADSSKLMTALRTKQAIDAWPFQSTRVGAGPVILSKQLDSIFTIRQLGAVGDGVADDTAAFNKMAAAGGTIRLTRGTYKLTGVVTIDAPLQMIIDAGVTINVTHTGAGIRIRSSDVYVLGNKSSEIVGPRVATEYVFGSRGLLIDGPNVAGRLKRVSIDALNLRGFSEAGIHTEHTEDLRIEACRILDVTYSGVMNLSGIRPRVHGNRIANIAGTSTGGTYLTAYGIAFSRDNAQNLTVAPRCVDFLCSGNTVESVTQHEAYDTHGGYGGRFIDNVSRDCRVGLNASANPGGGDNSSPLHLTVANNRFYAPLTAGLIGQAVTVVGDSNELARGILVRGNVFDGWGNSDAANRRPASGIAYSEASTWSGNLYTGNSRDTLLSVDGGNQALDIGGNVFHNVFPVAGNNRAIAVTGTQNVCKISGNSFVNLAGGTMYSMLIAAQTGGWAVGVARDNQHHNYTPYEGSSASNRIDIGASPA